MPFKEEVEATIQKELSLLKERISNNIRSQKANASGETIKSMQVIREEWGGKLVGRSFFSVLETGRKPGKIPYNFVGIILQWMAVKGINATPITYKRKASDRWQPKYTPQQRGNMAMAGGIAYNTKKLGSKLYREGGRENIFSNEIPKTIEAINRSVLQIMKIEVKQSIMRK